MLSLEIFRKNQPSDSLVNKALTLNTDKIKENDAFDQFLIWYGVDAIAHMSLLAIAQEIVHDEKSLQTFTTQFNIQFPHKGFTASIGALSEAGVYIPPQKDKGDLYFFDQDNNNHIPHWWGDEDQIQYDERLNHWYELSEREWSSQDFLNKDLLKVGVQYGYELWKLTLTSYYSTSQGREDPYFIPNSEVKKVSRPLAIYYDNFATELMSQYGPKPLEEVPTI